MPTRSDAPLLSEAFGHRSRDPRRLALKASRMLENPFAFFRACAIPRYRDFSSLADDLPAPAAWVSGDAHLENIGAYRSWAGHSCADITDFDEAHLGLAHTDILTLLASMFLGAESSSLPAEPMARGALRSFLFELSFGKARWLDERSSEGAARALIAKSQNANMDKWLSKRSRSEGGRLRVEIDGDSKLWKPSSRDRQRAKLLFRALGYPKTLRFEDSCVRASGLGSLGLERHFVLATDRASGALQALDIKERAPGSFSRSPIASAQPAWASEAERVHWAQMALQAMEPGLFSFADALQSSFVGKELLPSSMRLDLSRAAKTPGSLESACESYGRLLAWGSLRASGRLGAAPAEALSEWAAGADPETLLSAARRWADLSRSRWLAARAEAALFGGPDAWLQAWLDAAPPES